MTITAGRFVWPSNVAALEDRSRLTVDGAELVVRLYGQSSADVWDLVSWCRIVRGLVQPFTVDDEPSLSRWWRVEAADVDSLGVAATGEVVLRLSLGAIRDGGRPLVESLLHGQPRSLTILGTPAANAKPWHAVPHDTGYRLANATGTVSSVVRATEHGALRLYTSTVNSDMLQGASLQQPAVSHYRMAPVDAYVGACRVEALVDGVWRTVHGLELPAGLSGHDVRVTNGLVRVGRNAPLAGGRMTVSAWHWETDQWTDEVEVHPDVPTTLGSSAMVRRNSAEVCMVAWEDSAGRWLSVTVRRGAYLPVMTYAQPAPENLTVSVSGRTGPVLSLTNADRADAGANTIVMSQVLQSRAAGSGSTISWNMVAGPGSGSQAFVGGILPPGVDAQTEIDYWHAQQSERVRVPS